MKKLLPIIILLFAALPAYSQTDLVVSDLHVPSLVSPYYFGPNAFPIPDMLDGTTIKDLRVELAGNNYTGFEKDLTTDISLKLTIPLFSDRVNLSVWMPVVEFWRNTLERQRTCRLQDEKVMTGCESGDVYISTDMWILQADRHWIDASLRAGVKTASGNGFATARYYDCPGYFFDASFAKPIKFKDSFFEELRIAASGGFLCWQTGNGRQNDAVMYGAMVKLKTRLFTLSETFGGYSGWEGSASRVPELYPGDCPMSLKTDLVWHIRRFDLIFRYQYGLRDYPFHHFRLGLAYNFPLKSLSGK